MSSEALAWAFKQSCKSSSVKFTLIALCECANYKSGRIHPSIEHLCEITGQNRKTIISNIAELEAAGLIRDTDERTGRTGQIKIYEAACATVPKTEQSQKRNSSVSGRKESQKRDTEPSLEPSIGLADAKPKRARKAVSDFTVPDWIPEKPWAAYLDMRRKKGAWPTDDAVGLMVGKLERWRAQGHDPGEILNNSTMNNWTGIFEPKDGRNGTNFQTSGGNGPDRRDGFARALDRRIQQIEGSPFP